jgi:predicted MFS family arabinose efflux permease
MGRLLIKQGPKPMLLVAHALLVLSCVLLLLLGAATPLAFTVVVVFATGIAFGGSFTTVTVAVQNASGNKNRGAMMGVMALARSLGSTMGVSMFGTVFNIVVVNWFAGIGVPNVAPNDVYTLAATNPLVSAAQVAAGIMATVHVQMICIVVLAIVTLVLTFALPKLRFKQ